MLWEKNTNGDVQAIGFAGGEVIAGGHFGKVLQQNGTNEVNHAHTFTVTVKKDLGDGSGFVAASGVSVSGTLLAGNRRG